MSISENRPFFFCRVYNSIVPWLKTLSSIPAGAAPGPAEVPRLPPWDFKPKQQGLGLTTPVQPEQLGMNLMHVGSSLHFHAGHEQKLIQSSSQPSQVNEPNHVIKHRAYGEDRTNLSMHHLFPLRNPRDVMEQVRSKMRAGILKKKN